MRSIASFKQFVRYNRFLGSLINNIESQIEIYLYPREAIGSEIHFENLRSVELVSMAEEAIVYKEAIFIPKGFMECLLIFNRYYVYKGFHLFPLPTQE